MKIVKVFLLFFGFIKLSSGLFAADVEETTAVTPEFSFRQASLDRRKSSVYHRPVHKNYAHQLYLSLKLVRTYDYVHEIVLEPAIRNVKTNPNEIETVIDQAYVSSKWNAFDLTAGKKTEYEGSGYFVNPSDLLNEDKDLFDPMYQREGKVFTRLRLRNDFASAALGYIPSVGEDAKYGKTWAQLSLDIWQIESKLQYTYHAQELSTMGFSVARFFGDTFELHTDNRYMQKQRQGNRELPHSENYQKDDASFYSLVGSRLVLTSRRTIIVEAINNQSGLLSDEMEKFFLSEREAVEKTGQFPLSRIIGRQYAYAAYVDEESIAKTLVTFSSLYNLDDASAFTAAEIKYTLSPITSIAVAPVFYTGNKLTEFGEYPYKQITYLMIKGRF